MVDHPVLATADYRQADDLEEVGALLEQEGVQLPDTSRYSGRTDPSPREEAIYETAKQDWWTLQREDYSDETVDRLPSTTVETGGTRFHIHGINHGGGEGMPLSDDVEAFLNREVGRFIDAGHEVYVEDGVHALFPGFTGKDGAEGFEVLKDQSIAALIDDDFYSYSPSVEDFRELRLQFERTVRQAEEEEVDDREYDRAAVTLASTKDKDRVKDFQNMCYAERLPIHLEEAYAEQYDQEKDMMVNKRSRFMAEEAVEKSGSVFRDAPTRDVHLIVGAAHQPQIATHLEQLGSREIVTIRDRPSYSVAENGGIETIYRRVMEGEQIKPLRMAV